MNIKLLYGKKIILAFTAVFLISLYSFSVDRTWVGAGNGGTGTNFNASANWSPSGTPSSGDNLTITTATSATITLSASVTVNDLRVVASSSSGANILQLTIGAYTLTINGTAYFDCVRYSSMFSYDMTVIQVNSGTIIINGTATVHGTGNGYNTFIRANTSSPGDFIFRGDATFGTWARTEPGIEPDLIFDKAGAQTLTFNMSVDHVKGEDIIFGLLNSPVVTVAGTSGAQGRFQPYDGNLTINANTVVNANYSTLDRFTGTGTCTMNSGSVLNINYTNDFPAGYSPISLNATSTVEYLGVSTTQSVTALTYGHLIAGGSGIKNAVGNIVVQGNFLVRSGATYRAANSTTLRTHNLRGNFTNDGTFTTNASYPSTFIFDGTISQYIQGSVSSTFYNLTCNKSSGTLFLGINTTAGTGSAGVTYFQAGPLNLNGYTLIVANPATTAVTRTIGYAISETNLAVNPSILQWNIGTTTGAHVFPFGRADGTYIPVTFNNSGSAGNVSISTRRTTDACTSPCTSAGYCNLPLAGASNVAAVSNMYDSNVGGDGTCAAVIDRWWNVTSSLASPLAAGVTLSLTYAGGENTMSPFSDVIAMQHWNGSVWNAGTSTGTATGTFINTGSAGVNTGTQTVSGSGIVYFSPFVLSRVTAPLPVELLSFAADCKADKVISEWETASEQNADYFTLEKSLDGSIYYPVTKIKAAGNSSTVQTYSAEDAEPFSAASYYRLSETDFNGATEVFTPVAVKGCGSDVISAFSNGNQVTVTVNSKADNLYNIFVYDVHGKIVFEKKEFFPAGNNSASYSLHADNGIYYLKIFSEENLRVQKIAVQK